MNKEELQSILDLHEKWLSGEEGGKRAFLYDVNLTAADLTAADLTGADLRGATINISAKDAPTSLAYESRDAREASSELGRNDSDIPHIGSQER